MTGSRTLPSLTPLAAARLIFWFAAATIVGAWIFEAMGFLPCDLCLKQRIPYYLGIPLAALTAYAARRGAAAARAGLAIIALLFLASAALAFYHSGVELKVFAGSSDCAGALNKAGSVEEFLNQLQHVKVVRCDEPALRVFGLSLSNWNVVISAGLALVAAAGWRSGKAHKGFLPSMSAR